MKELLLSILMKQLPLLVLMSGLMQEIKLSFNLALFLVVFQTFVIV